MIDDDLRIWKERGGISKSDFDMTDGRGVHYQIINHKLYREDECMFSFRLVQVNVYTYSTPWKVMQNSNGVRGLKSQNY